MVESKTMMQDLVDIITERGNEVARWLEKSRSEREHHHERIAELDCQIAGAEDDLARMGKAVDVLTGWDSGRDNDTAEFGRLQAAAVRAQAAIDEVDNLRTQVEYPGYTPAPTSATRPGYGPNVKD